MNIEQLKLWLDFAKFISASVVVALITFWINAGFKDRQITLEEQNHLAGFKEDALTENVAHRRRLAEYFSSVTISKDLKSGWNDYLILVTEEFDKTLKAEETKALLVRELETKIARLESEVDENDAELKAAQADKVQAQIALQSLRSDLATTPPNPFGRSSSAYRQFAQQFMSEGPITISTVLSGKWQSDAGRVWRIFGGEPNFLLTSQDMMFSGSGLLNGTTVIVAATDTTGLYFRLEGRVTELLPDGTATAITWNTGTGWNRCGPDECNAQGQEGK